MITDDLLRNDTCTAMSYMLKRFVFVLCFNKIITIMAKRKKIGMTKVSADMISGVTVQLIGIDYQFTFYSIVFRLQHKNWYGIK